MKASDWFAFIAILVSTISFGISFFHSLKSSRASIRPILAVVYTKTGWHLKNIGNGPALNILVAQKPIQGRWIRPVRVPPIPSGGNFYLEWIGHDNEHGIGVFYEDFQGREYSSVCGNDLTKISKGSIFPRWTDQEIGRHWWKNPIKPTAPGEIRGDWEGD